MKKEYKSSHQSSIDIVKSFKAHFDKERNKTEVFADWMTKNLAQWFF